MSNPRIARALHARRALEQALDHGAALLAALGLPQIVDDGFVPIDREAAGDALTAAVALLDEIDPDPDLEPSLGAPERHPSGFALFGGTDASDRQSQAFWSDGGDPDGDREEDDPAELGDDDELDLGWSANVSQLALGRTRPMAISRRPSGTVAASCGAGRTTRRTATMTTKGVSISAGPRAPAVL